MNQEFNPQAPFITALQHLAPRNASAWNAMREILKDQQPHTWYELAEAATQTGIKWETAKQLLRQAAKYGYIHDSGSGKTRKARLA